MMNLSTDAWIPLANAAGEKKSLSLRQVFAEGRHWQDFAVRPHERVALMRLLICIAQAALGRPMQSLDGCLDELPAKAEAYLVKWHDSFDLFHPTKPFLQFAGLVKLVKDAAKKTKNKKTTAPVETKDEEETSPSKLDFALATKNNTTLFDHNAASDKARVFTPAQLALMLITFQCFSPGGTIGVARWNGTDTPGKGSSGHAPCCPSAMLHAFIRCNSIIATIAANLLTLRTVNDLYRKDSWGLPVWESMPESFGDSKAIENATHTYLGRLMPLSRAILLRSDGTGLLLANGLDYPSPPEFPSEPSASMVKKWDESGHALVGAGNRALWRELPAMMVRRKIGEPGGPLTLIEINNDEPFDLWVGALMTNKASILDTVEGVYSIPAKMMRDEGRKAYESEVEHSDQRVRRALAEATETYRRLLELKPQGYPEKAVALRHYWTQVDQSVSMLNAYINAEDGSDDAEAKRQAWRFALWRAARDAFQAACPNETPRQKRAYALALRSLQGSQRKKDETPTPAMETQ